MRTTHLTLLLSCALAMGCAPGKDASPNTKELPTRAPEPAPAETPKAPAPPKNTDAPKADDVPKAADMPQVVDVPKASRTAATATALRADLEILDLSIKRWRAYQKKMRPSVFGREGAGESKRAYAKEKNHGIVADAFACIRHALVSGEDTWASMDPKPRRPCEKNIAWLSKRRATVQGQLKARLSPKERARLRDVLERWEKR